MFHSSRQHEINHPDPASGPREQRGAQDLVQAAHARARHIEKQAVEWAEHLISSAQERANDIVAAAEERAEDVMTRSTWLTRGYLRDVFELLDDALPGDPPEVATAPDTRYGTPPRPRIQRDRSPAPRPDMARPGAPTGRTNLGIVPNMPEVVEVPDAPGVPDANESA